MAFPTAVNSQITDAVTQSNVKVIAESPALAMGTLYQTLAHSTGILFENAVAAQQVQNTLALAAANQGVIQIYSVDTMAGAVAKANIGQSDVPDTLSSLLTALSGSKAGAPSAKAVETQKTEAADAAKAGTAKTDATGDDVIDRIRAAVDFSNDTVLGHAPAVVDGVRNCVDAMAQALDAMNRVTHDNMVRILLEAALAMTLAAMIREPEKSAEYEAVLQAIKRMA